MNQVAGLVFLCFALSPVTPRGDPPIPQEEEIATLVNQLGDRTFARRQSATQKLSDLGEPALPALRRAATTMTDAEVRRRATDLVRAIEDRLYRELQKFIGHTENAFALHVASDDRHVLTGGEDRTARLWDMATGKELRRFTKHTGRVIAVAMSPDRERAASGGWDKTVRVWSPTTGEEYHCLRGHQGVVSVLLFSSDGFHLLSGDSEGELRLWKVRTGKELGRLKKNRLSVHALAYSTNGQSIFSGQQDGSVRRWDIKSNKDLQWIGPHTGSVRRVTLSRDARLCLTIPVEELSTWPLKDVERRAELRRIKPSVEGASGYGVAISADGGRALCGGRDGIVRLWDLASGKELRRYPGHSGWIWDVAFTHDGRRALSAGADGTVRLWSLPP